MKLIVMFNGKVNQSKINSHPIPKKYKIITIKFNIASVMHIMEIITHVF